MGRAVRSPRTKTPITNALQGYAADRGRAKGTMARFAVRRATVCRGIAPTDIVAATLAREAVWLVRLPKKVAASTGNADQLQREPIPTTNAPLENAPERERARRPWASKMEARAARDRNARRGIASTKSVAIRRARERARLARRQRRAKVPTGRVVPLQRARIPTMNARPVRAAERARAKATTASYVARARNVCPGIAWMDIAAAARVRRHAEHVRLPRRVAASMVNAA